MVTVELHVGEGQKRNSEHRGVRELALIFQETEEQAAEREEYAAVRIHDRKQLALETNMREREDRREEPMVSMCATTCPRYQITNTLLL